MTDQPAGTPEPPKGLESLLQAAFRAGVRHGVGYEEVAAIPEAETKIQFRAFMDDWHGRTWSPQQWHRARFEAGMTQDHPDCICGTEGTRYTVGADPDCPVHGIVSTDDDLPGMWSKSDYEGGIEEVRGPDWTPPKEDADDPANEGRGGGAVW